MDGLNSTTILVPKFVETVLYLWNISQILWEIEFHNSVNEVMEFSMFYEFCEKMNFHILDGKSRWSVKVDRDKHLEQIPGALGDPICNIAQERIWYLAPLENEPWGHFNLLLAKKFLLYKKGWPELLSHGLKFSCQETLLISEDLLNSFSIII